MTIEFHCPDCGKLLRTNDDMAGVSAPCSGCGALVTVPLPQPVVEAAVSADPVEVEPAVAAVLPGAIQPVIEITTNCPMCGTLVPVGSARCPACGESLAADRVVATGQPTRIRSGDLLYRTWRVFTSNLGITIGGVLLALVLQQLLTWGLGTVALRSGMPLTATPLLFLIPLVSGVFFQAGQIILLVKVARGETARISDLFAGGRFFWRYLGSSILFMLILIPASMLLLIPGLIVGLMFWPVFYVIVVDDAPVLAAFGRAGRLTQGNKLTTFVMWLALVGAQLPLMIGLGILRTISPELGAMSYFAWLILTMPFLLLLFAMTYTAMSGVPTAEQLPSTRSAN